MTEAPEFAVVMPIGPGRRENVDAAISALNAQEYRPKLLVLVCDGEDAWLNPSTVFTSMPSRILHLPKHHPGGEQPRNAGVREVDKMRHEFEEMYGSISHIWFLDSDIITQPDCLARYVEEMERGGQEGVYIGPYDWLPPGTREIDLDLRNDPDGVAPPGRWGLFEEHEPGTRYVEDLSKGLACFSGNLVWQIDDFICVGGFWNDLHHGRCEDGELGIRAVAMGIPIGVAVGARGWHLHHDRNFPWIIAANERDVPMLNERHPWMERRCTCRHENVQHGLVGEEYLGPCSQCDCQGFNPSVFMVEEDGKRFDCACPRGCGWTGNTALIWTHITECEREQA